MFSGGKNFIRIQKSDKIKKFKKDSDETSYKQKTSRNKPQHKTYQEKPNVR